MNLFISQGNVKWYKVSPACDPVAVLVEECHAGLQAALEDALVIFEQVHHDSPYDHAQPGECLELLRHEGYHARFLEALGAAFDDSREQVENYLLVDCVLIPPNYIGADDSRYEGEDGVMTFENLLQNALGYLVDEYK